jgi:hypothetical protein
MFSKILLKLIEESLIPAFGFLLLKVVITLYMVNSLGYNTNIYNVFSLEVPKDLYNVINSYILVSFALFCFLGVVYTLAKSLFFHKSHVKPSITLGLYNFRVGFLIQNSFHLFSQALIWLIFSYMGFIISAFLYYLGLVNGYVVLLNSILCPIATYFFVLDVEYELEQNSEDTEEVYISQ